MIFQIYFFFIRELKPKRMLVTSDLVYSILNIYQIKREHLLGQRVETDTVNDCVVCICNYYLKQNYEHAYVW